MKTYGRIIPLAFCVLFGAPIQAGAGKAIGVPRATPSAIFAAESAVVTITAPVAVEPNSPPLSINLMRVNERGKPNKALGQLYDDGSHGDASRGDNTFTGQFSFNESNPVGIRLVVTVAHRGTLLRTHSPIFTLDVRRRSANVERQPTMQDQRHAARNYETQRSEIGINAARRAIAACLDRRRTAKDNET